MPEFLFMLLQSVLETDMQMDVNAKYFYPVIYLEISKFIIAHRGKDSSTREPLRTEGRLTEIINNKLWSPY